MVMWPWKDRVLDLPENYQLAFGHLLQMLVKSPALIKQYEDIIQEQLNQEIIERLTSDSEEGSVKHFIPHHPMITPSKNTTKVHILYNASAKTRKSNLSLNECLYRGPCDYTQLVWAIAKFFTQLVWAIAKV